MNQQRLILTSVLTIGAMLLLIVIGGLWWALERVEVETDGTQGPRARANPYLALTRTLDQMGLPTTARPALVLPAEAEGSLVFLFPPPQRLSVEQAESALAWVERGGTLVVGLRQIGPEPDPLYQQLGLEQINEGLTIRLDEEGEEGEEADDSAAPEGEEPAEDPAEDPEEHIVEDPDADEASADEDAEDEEPPQDFISLLSALSDVDEREPRLLGMDYGDWEAEVAEGRWLQARGGELRATWLAGDDPEHRPPRFTAARMDRGAGRLIALADPSLFDNAHLDDAEHARMLWEEWADPALGVERVVVIYRVDDEDILDRLWTLAWPAVLSTLALVLVWLWGAWGRFGPLVAPPSKERRSLLEHIEATGTFLWRKGEQATMLESLRAEVLGSLSARHGGQGELSEQDRVAALAERARVDPERVRLALHGGEDKDRRAFTDTVEALQELRRTR
ncbi:MAG: DUF4350 domain-containing protein [Alphaproteobacteria bacterium]|nr:DUF4350 domain-containing protein [Alphaproteobacteria bacterium]